ncbi:Anamorsin -like protein [Halotydeus destructor]|nr:Anamorsin -like protein [Halotydeus destructor]
MTFTVSSGEQVLVCYTNCVDAVLPNVEEYRKSIGEKGFVETQDLKTISDTDHSPGTFDKVLFGVNDPEKKVLHDEIAEKLLSLLKPNGQLTIKKSTKDDCTADSIVSALKLSGFINVSESKDEISASKPDYSTGSSMKLNLDNIVASTNVWTLKDGDEELINEDELLDEEDLKKPDPESLRVCGSTGKRKACADCSCGLAEELASEEVQKVRENTQNAKSSCGSCYLGDAFRCAGCPYRGMPAFKPGEKVTIDMSSDI